MPRFACLFVFLFLLSATVVAQDVDTIPSVVLPPELERVLRDYEESWKAGDPEGLAELFTTDGFVLSSERQPVRGRKAILQRYTRTGGNLILRALSYEVSDSIGYIVGGYTYNPDGREIGKFVLALRKSSSGRWLIAADIDNSNAGREN